MGDPKASNSQDQLPRPPGNVTIEKSIDYVLENEGGYTNDPNDSGGPTNLGLTFEDLKECGIPATIEEIKSLTRDKAIPIYRHVYWDPMGLGSLKDQNIATCIFDQGVLAGKGTAIKYAQLALNNCGSSVAVDGHIGAQTITALNAVNRSKFIGAFFSLVKEHYATIVANNPSQGVFLKGWMNRANRLLSLS